MNFLILLPIILPILAGVLLLVLPVKVWKNRRSMLTFSLVMLMLSAVCAFFVIASTSKANNTLTLFYLVDKIPVYFSVDRLGKIFASLVTVVMVLVEFFSVGYLGKEHGTDIEDTQENRKKEKRYHGFYLLVYGVLIGLDFAGNLVTLYLFYEIMTLVSAPLVLHTETREAIMAGLKYLIYSFCGAYMALFGIYFLYQYTDTLDFTVGGALQTAVIAAEGKTGFMLVVVFLMILGFGVKAGMFPLHAWLPTAHPVAPAPASAMLSGIIVKSGVLAIIRVIFYVTGPEFIRGTWVQITWIILAMMTVLMGSALAFKEKVFKKRLAYSTVSNLSYILLGLSMLTPVGMTGAMLHVVFHALIKSCLFLCAGYVIAMTGKTKVSEFAGMGKKMPWLFGCYTIAALGLIGIPPTCGVVSKWYLATGALDADISVISLVAPVVLLVSALLTAGYLLPISIQGFLAKEKQLSTQEKLIHMVMTEDGEIVEHTKSNMWMLVPVIILAALIVLLGICPTSLINMISGIAAELM